MKKKFIKMIGKTEISMWEMKSRSEKSSHKDEILIESEDFKWNNTHLKKMKIHDLFHDEMCPRC